MNYFVKTDYNWDKYIAADIKDLVLMIAVKTELPRLDLFEKCLKGLDDTEDVIDLYNYFTGTQERIEDIWELGEHVYEEGL